MRASCCPAAAPRRSFASSSGASSTIAAARCCHEARRMSESSAILAAMYEGNTDALAALLAARPELDVFEAAAVGDAARIRQLVRARPPLVEAASGDGWTALHLALAAARGDVAIVEMLLVRGARAGVRAEDGRTPLAIAEEHGHTTAARRLRGEMP